MKKFNIKCGFCGNEDQREFQLNWSADDGYSNYTVLESGSLKIKCIKCGTFGDTDEYNDKGNNKIKLFEITCPNCESKNYTYNPQDVESEGDLNNIQCEKCGYKQYED